MDWLSRCHIWACTIGSKFFERAETHAVPIRCICEWRRRTHGFGGHLISELLWVTGLSIERLVSVTDRYPDDRRAIISLILSGGVLATIYYIGDSTNSERRLRSVYHGSAGTAFCHGLPFEISWKTKEGIEIISEDLMPSLPTLVGDWLNCIVSGEMPRGTAAHGVQVTKALAMAYESAADRFDRTYEK